METRSEARNTRVDDRDFPDHAADIADDRTDDGDGGQLGVQHRHDQEAEGDPAEFLPREFVHVGCDLTVPRIRLFLTYQKA